MSEKSLLDQWRDMAYDRNLPKDQLEKFWGTYFTIEREIYEQLLENPDEEVKGTVKELAEKYGQDVMTMVGFLDGINDSLKTANPIETMEEDTVVSLAFDKELLYKNMIDAKADWLYGLPQWDKIFDAETKKRLYREQKQSGTVRKAKKIGRNDPCPCGSGKTSLFYNISVYANEDSTIEVTQQVPPQAATTKVNIASITNAGVGRFTKGKDAKRVIGKIVDIPGKLGSSQWDSLNCIIIRDINEFLSHTAAIVYMVDGTSYDVKAIAELIVILDNES